MKSTMKCDLLVALTNQKRPHRAFMTVCQKFFSASLPDVHSFRINILVSMAVALARCGSDPDQPWSLSSGRAHVKNKIKRVDQCPVIPPFTGIFPYSAPAHTYHHPLMPFCVIAVDWTGWHDRNWYLLRASPVCNGRSLPLMSGGCPRRLAQNSDVQCRFLDRLHDAILKDKAVTIITWMQASGQTGSGMSASWAGASPAGSGAASASG